MICCNQLLCIIVLVMFSSDMALPFMDNSMDNVLAIEVDDCVPIFHVLRSCSCFAR